MRRVGALALAGLLVGASAVHGQVLTLSQPPGGEIGVEAAGLWIGLPQENGLRRFDTWQWLSARIGGAVWDPRLIGFQVAIRPQWRQTALSGLPEPSDEAGRWWGWDARLVMLPSRPLNASVSAVRSMNTLRTAVGTEIRQRLEGFTARAGFRNPYMPLELEYRASDQDQFWMVGPREWRGQQLSMDVLRFVAQNRKTALTLERNWVSDRAAGTHYVLDRDELRHTLAWGKGSRLSSRLGYLEQTGARAYRVASWTEGAHLQHTRSISTDYRFDLGSHRSAGRQARSRLVDGSIAYQLAPGLSAAAGGRSRFTGYGDGREELQQLRSRVDYRATLLPDVRLSAGVSMGYEWRGLEPATDQWLAVVDEPHVVDNSSRFSLNSPQIDPASVSLSAADRTLLYEAGIDYQQVEGLPSIEILVLPGGRMAIGDTVLASYRYQPFPTVRAEGLTGGYDARLTVRGIEVYHRRALREVTNGASPTTSPSDIPAASWLGEYQESAIGLRLSGIASFGAVDLGAERLERKIGNTYRATVSQARGSLTARLLRAVRGTVAGSASRTHTEVTGGFTMLAANASVGWEPVPSLRWQASLVAWEWVQEDARRNGFVGGDLELLWRPGRLTAEVRYSRNAWRDGAERTDDRLSLRLARTF